MIFHNKYPRTRFLKNNTMRKLIFALILLCSIAVQSATIYIDPSKHGQIQDGTILNPFDSWADFTIVSGNTYLQKCGTTFTSSAQFYILNKANIEIGSYGVGIRPIFKYTGAGAAVRIEGSNHISITNFEIYGTASAHSLFYAIGTQAANLTYIKIENCFLSNAHNSNNAGFGVYSWYCIGLEVINCTISNVALDGFYCRNTPGIKIEWCNVYDINKRYFNNPNEKYSSGDGIQLDGYYNGFHISNTIVQRNNGAGNKFDIILASAPGVSDNASGIIEDCVLITDNTVSTAIHIERGNGIIIRRNTFMGSTQGVRVGGAYAKNTIIEDNDFENCNRGVGVGYTYPSAGPATGTKVLNNKFVNVSSYHVWVDRSEVETCNNTTDGHGIPEYNYGGGSFIKCK